MTKNGWMPSTTASESTATAANTTLSTLGRNRAMMASITGRAPTYNAVSMVKELTK